MPFGCLFATIRATACWPDSQPASLILLPAPSRVAFEFVNSSLGCFVTLIWWGVGTTSNYIKITKNIISVVADSVNVLPNIFSQVFTLLQLLNDIIRNYYVLKNAWLKGNT